jgi:hypothetical protein
MTTSKANRTSKVPAGDRRRNDQIGKSVQIEIEIGNVPAESKNEQSKPEEWRRTKKIKQQSKNEQKSENDRPKTSVPNIACAESSTTNLAEVVELALLSIMTTLPS